MDTADRADDLRLMIAIGNGDQSALRQLYERHSTRVFRFLMRLVGNRSTAEELMNEVFLDCWRNARRFEGRAAPSTWLLAIARNKAYSKLRRGRGEEQLDDAHESIRDETPDPETRADHASHERVMRACIRELTADQREIIDLVYYQEQSVEEVAEIIGIPAGTVKSRLFHARRRLGELLRVRGVSES